MNVKTEVTQKDYISHFEKKITYVRSRIKNEFQTLSYYDMNSLMSSIKYYQGLIAFAKSGKQTIFFVYR